MATKSISVNLTVNADVTQAKKAMRELQNSLNTLASPSTFGKGFGESFQKEVLSAQKQIIELKNTLNNSFNVDTGKLDFTKFSQQIKNSEYSLQDYAKTLTNLGPQGINTFLQLTKAISTSEIPIIRISDKLKSLGTTFANTIKWQISSTVLTGFTSAISNAYTYAKNLNSSLNDIRIVTGQSAEQMASFAKRANEAAQALSTTTKTYTDASLIYYQQGLSDEEVEKRTNVTIKLAEAAGESATTVSSYMTAIWNNFSDGSDSLERFADVITKLGAATAASSQEIAGGLEKFASVANTVGLSYDYAAAAVTTIIDKTRQSEDVVGTSLKTIFARLEGLNLGETQDDGTTLNKYSEALLKVGVNIKDTDGQLKDMDDILTELGPKWKQLGQDQKIALAQTVGGMRQYNQFIALMDNFDAFQENIKLAENSEGTLTEQANIYAQSWEGASKRVQSALESIYDDLIDDDFFIEMTDFFADALKFIDEVIKGIGGVKGLLTQITPIILNIFSKNIANGLNNFNLSLMGMFNRPKLEADRDKQLNEMVKTAVEVAGGDENNAQVLKVKDEQTYQTLLMQRGKTLTDQQKIELSMMHQIRQTELDQLEAEDEEIKKIQIKNGELETTYKKLRNIYTGSNEAATAGTNNANVDAIRDENINVESFRKTFSHLNDNNKNKQYYMASFFGNNANNPTQQQELDTKMNHVSEYIGAQFGLSKSELEAYKDAFYENIKILESDTASEEEKQEAQEKITHAYNQIAENLYRQGLAVDKTIIGKTESKLNSVYKQSINENANAPFVPETTAHEVNNQLRAAGFNINDKNSRDSIYRLTEETDADYSSDMRLSEQTHAISNAMEEEKEQLLSKIEELKKQKETLQENQQTLEEEKNSLKTQEEIEKDIIDIENKYTNRWNNYIAPINKAIEKDNKIYGNENESDRRKTNASNRIDENLKKAETQRKRIDTQETNEVNKYQEEQDVKRQANTEAIEENTQQMNAVDKEIAEAQKRYNQLNGATKTLNKTEEETNNAEKKYQKEVDKKTHDLVEGIRQEAKGEADENERKDQSHHGKEDFRKQGKEPYADIINKEPKLTLAEQFTDISMAATSATAAIESYTNMLDVLLDKDSSLLEKGSAIVQWLTSTAMSFGMLGSNRFIQSLFKSKKNTTDAAEKTTETVATETNTATTKVNTEAKIENAEASKTESTAEATETESKEAGAVTETANTDATKVNTEAKIENAEASQVENVEETVETGNKEVNTGVETANTDATKVNTEAKIENAGASQVEGAAAITAGNGAKKGATGFTIFGKTLSTTALGIAGIVAAIAVLILSIEASKNKIKEWKEEIKSFNEVAEKVNEYLDLREEHAQAVSSMEEVITSYQQGTSTLEEYQQSIADTAEALGIENAKLYEQYNAYDALIPLIRQKQAAEDHTSAGAAQESFVHYGAQIYGAIAAQNTIFDSFGGASIVQDGNTFRISSGGGRNEAGDLINQSEDDKAAIQWLVENGIQDIEGLGIEYNDNGVGTITIDAETLQSNAGATLAAANLFSKVEGDLDLQGLDSVIVDAILEMGQNLSEEGWTGFYQTVSDTYNGGLSAATAESINTSNINTATSLADYNTQRQQIRDSVSQEYGYAISDIEDTLADSLASNNYEVVLGLLQTYAENHGFDVNDLIDIYDSLGTDKRKEQFVTAASNNANGMSTAISDYFVNGNLSSITDVITNFVNDVNSLNIDTLADNFETLSNALGDLSAGDVITGNTSTNQEKISNLEDILGDSLEDYFTVIRNSSGGIEQLKAKVDSSVIESAYRNSVTQEVFSGYNNTQNLKVNDTTPDRTIYASALQHFSATEDRRFAAAIRSNDLSQLSNAAIQNLFGLIYDHDTDAFISVATGLRYKWNGHVLQEIDDDNNFIKDGNRYTTYDLITGLNAINSPLVDENGGNGFYVKGYSDSNIELFNDTDTYVTKEEKNNQLEQYRLDYENLDKTIEEVMDDVSESNGLFTQEMLDNDLTSWVYNQAEALGIETDEVADYNTFLQDNNQLLAENQGLSAEVATNAYAMSEGISSLANNFDSWNEILKDGYTGTKEQQEALDNLETAFQQIFGTTDDISDDFLLQHLSLMQDYLNGDDTALNQISQDYVQLQLLSSEYYAENKQEYDNLLNLINNVPIENIEVGASIDDQEFIDTLNNMLKQTIITEGQVRQILSASGMTGHWSVNNGRMLLSDIVASDSSDTNIDLKNYRNSASSSSSRSTQSKKDYDDEYERYYKITREIQDQADALERLSTAKDRAFGKAKLTYIEQESAALENELALQQQYLDEIESYYKQDQANLNYFGATYDENGVLTNYDQIVKAQVDEYNAAVDRYNAGGSEEDYDQAEKKWTYFQDVLSQYDETNQLWQEQLDKLQELKNEYYDKQLEHIQTELDIKVSVDDRELKVLDYQLSRIQDKAFSTAEALATESKQLDVQLNKQQAYQTSIDQILANHNVSMDTIAGLSDAEIANLGFTESEIEALDAGIDGLTETQEKIDEIQNDIIDGPLNVMKEWNEEFDRLEENIDNAASTMKSLRNILDLTKSNNGLSTSFALGLQQQQYGIELNAIGAATTEYNTNQSLLEKARKDYEEAVASGADSNTLDRLKKNIQEMETTVNTSYKNMLSNLETALQSAQDLLSSTVDKAKEEFEDLTSASGDYDFDQTIFDHAKALDDMYLDDYQKIYEFSKLTRDINKSMENESSLENIERYQEVLNEIQALEESGEEVSEYQVNALRAKYELAQAYANLQDAQNAKSTVKMTRDSEGNYGYVYSAGDTSDELQAYEDKLYEYQKLNSEYIKNTEETMEKLNKEYAESMAEIAKNTTLTPEEKKKRQKELTTYYTEMAKALGGELDTALAYNKDLYNNYWTWYSEKYDYAISKEGEYQTQFKYTTLGVMYETLPTGEALVKQFTDAISGDNGYVAKCENAWNDYAKNQEKAMNKAGYSFSTFGVAATAAANAASKAAAQAEKDVTASSNQMVIDFNNVESVLKKMTGLKLDAIRAEIVNTIDTLDSMINAYANVAAAAETAQQRIATAATNTPSLSPYVGDNNTGTNGSGKTISTTYATTSWNDLGFADKMRLMAQYISEVYKKRSDYTDSSSLLKWNTLVQVMQKFKKGFAYSTKEEDVYKGLSEIFKKENDLNKLYNTLGGKGYLGFDTGGYTGAWNSSEGRLAMLHQKELVLNADDTKNMLTMVDMVRDVVSQIDTSSLKASLTAAFSSPSFAPGQFEQNVHITATFTEPATKETITAAFDTLINQATQYANRKIL